MSTLTDGLEALTVGFRTEDRYPRESLLIDPFLRKQNRSDAASRIRRTLAENCG